MHIEVCWWRIEAVSLRAEKERGSKSREVERKRRAGRGQVRVCVPWQEWISRLSYKKRKGCREEEDRMTTMGAWR